MVYLPLMKYDVAIIGLGVYGAALSHALASSGLTTLGLDAHRPPHNLGSSHGGSRLFRFTTLESESYLQLAREAAELWDGLAVSAGKAISRPSGMVLIEDAGAERQRHHGATGVVDAAVALANKHNIPHEVLTAAALQARYPRFCLDASARAYLEPGAITLDAELAHKALLEAGQAAGATLRFDEEAQDLVDCGADGVMVRSSQGTYWADRVIVAAGPWVNHLIDTRQRLRILPQPVAWFPDEMPDEAFLPFVHVRRSASLVFGFPEFTPGEGIKVVLENESASVALPGQPARALIHEMQHDLRAAHVPVQGLGDQAMHRQTCYYTSSDDGRLRVGDASLRIGYVSACSGHGFKFAPAIAQRVAAALRSGRSLDSVLSD